MALITAITWKDVELPSAYFRIFYLQLNKDENQLVAQFQLHASDKKGGCLDHISITTDYIPGEDLFVTAFNALKRQYENSKDI